MMGASFAVGSWTVPAGVNKLFDTTVANMTFSNFLPAGPSAEQLDLFVTVAGAVNAIVHLQWSNDQVTPFNEIVEELGALAAGERRFTCNTKAWGPLAAGAVGPVIERPVAGLFFRVGIYSDGVPGVADSVVVTGLLQRGGALQGGA